MEFQIHKIKSIIELPSRQTWGESWWTARDMCLTNEPELPEPLKTLADRLADELFRAFIFGEESRTP